MRWLACRDLQVSVLAAEARLDKRYPILARRDIRVDRTPRRRARQGNRLSFLIELHQHVRYRDVPLIAHVPDERPLCHSFPPPDLLTTVSRTAPRLPYLTPHPAPAPVAR